MAAIDEHSTVRGPSRAGNAMGRARAGALSGALRSVVERGTARSTMSGIAVSGALAKATLYNHFRTKDDVWAALVADEVDGLAALAADASVADRLAAVAGALATHPALERLRTDEPATICRLSTLGPDGAWARARAYVRAGLGEGTADEAVDVTLRWLTSHIAAPGDAHSRHAGALLIAAALAPTPVLGP
jgi:AcrR family transcriptional regulator